MKFITVSYSHGGGDSVQSFAVCFGGVRIPSIALSHDSFRINCLTNTAC